MFPLLFMGGVGFQELLLLMVLFWIPGYFIARAILRKTALRNHTGWLAMIFGVFVVAPVLAFTLTITIFFILSVFA